MGFWRFSPHRTSNGYRCRRGGPDWHASRAGLGGETVSRCAVGRSVQAFVAKAAADGAPCGGARAPAEAAPLAERLGTVVSNLDNFDSFECRGRNRVVGAQLSEHGRANALDVRAFKFVDGSTISLTDRTVPRGLRENVLHSACTRFSTVLGPGSDGYHEDHIHLDLMERRNNYRICQWDVWDPLPQKAPLLPAERPDEAPPREVAAKPDDAKSDAKHDAEPDAEKSSAEKPDEAEPPREEKPAKKKRRQNRRS